MYYTSKIKLKRKVVEIMALILKYTGINVTEDRKTLFSEYKRISVYVFFLSYGYIGTIMFSIVNRGEFYNFVIPTAYIGALTVLMTGVLLLFFYKKKIFYMLRYMDENIFTYKDEYRIHPRYSWILNNENIILKYCLVMSYEITGYFFVCGSPFMGYFVSGRMKPYIYPGWTPWKVDGMTSCVITYLSQVCVVTTSLWGYYVTLVYVLFSVIEFIRQYKRLGESLSSINYRAEKYMLERFNYDEILIQAKYETNTFQEINFGQSNMKPKFRTMYNQLITENIIDCIKHHQKLQETFNLFKSWFLVAFSIELGSCMSTYALVFYCLLEVTDFERLSSLIGVAFVAIANLFARCAIGEIFAGMNETVVEKIFYDTKWEQQNRNNKKLLSIFIMQCRRPMKLFGFSVFQASLYTFSSIIRASYSYLNLIRASLRN